jgi:hypothetical protein
MGEGFPDPCIGQLLFCAVDAGAWSDMNTAIPLKERILASAAATPSLTRHQGRRLTVWLLALSVAVAFALFELLGGLTHSRDRPLALTVRLADGWALLSAVLTSLVRNKVGVLVAYPRLLVAATLACPVALYAWIGHFHGTYAEPPTEQDWPCLALSVLVSAIPLTLFLRLNRGVEPRYPEVFGAAGGATCAAWAAVLVLLWCPCINARHVLMGHVLPIAFMTIVGSVVGSSTLRFSRPTTTAVVKSWRSRPSSANGETRAIANRMSRGRDE